jgi:UDP-N-acetylmuramyl pentapeptide synthase
MAEAKANAARDAGLAAARAFAETPAAASELKRELRAGDTVLLKASRSARLERVTEALRQADGNVTIGDRATDK